MTSQAAGLSDGITPSQGRITMFENFASHCHGIALGPPVHVFTLRVTANDWRDAERKLSTALDIVRTRIAEIAEPGGYVNQELRIGEVLGLSTLSTAPQWADLRILDLCPDTHR